VTEGPPDPSTYRIPSLPRRIAVGVLIAIPLVILIVAVPFEILTRLSGAGVTTPLPGIAVLIAGLVVTGFAVARHIVRPTRAFGPVTIAGSAFGVGYLLFISHEASAVISSHSTTITLSYGSIFLLLIVVPLLNIGSGVATTVEDVRHPGERLPFDYPV
jgi:hypothetical protein